MWGVTELAGAASANPVVGPNKPGTIGIAYPGNSMQVVDIDDASVVLEPGARGELMFRGPLVMDGYYGNAEATSASIQPDGWLHSGDIATMDEDGYVTIVDRKTDMILTAGYNVYPAELRRRATHLPLPDPAHRRTADPQRPTNMAATPRTLAMDRRHARRLPASLHHRLNRRRTRRTRHHAPRASRRPTRAPLPRPDHHNRH